MLRSIDFKTMPYLFTDKAGTCLTVEFDGRELDDIYKQVKAMYDQAHSSDDMPTEPGWYATRDGEDLLSYDGDAWHIHNIDCDSSVFIVITLGVIAILCVLTLLGVFVCIFDHDDKNDKSSKE